MQNETKFSPEMMNSLFQLMKKGKGNSESVKSILEQSLSEGQKKAVSKIMSDPQKLKELLASPQAKELMAKLSSMQGENKNGPA